MFEEISSEDLREGDVVAYVDNNFSNNTGVRNVIVLRINEVVMDGFCADKIFWSSIEGWHESMMRNKIPFHAAVKSKYYYSLGSDACKLFKYAKKKWNACDEVHAANLLMMVCV